MAFQLKSMLGHMIRPKQQAVAIASNNTDTMFAAIAPASPTIQAQTQRMAAATAESMLAHQSPQPQHNSNATQQQRPSSARMVPSQSQSTRVASPTMHTHYDGQQQHANLYALPQLLNQVPSHRLIRGPVYSSAYNTGLPGSSTQQTQATHTQNIAQNGQAAIPTFYLPQSQQSDMLQSQPSQFQGVPQNQLVQFTNQQQRATTHAYSTHGENHAIAYNSGHNLQTGPHTFGGNFQTHVNATQFIPTGPQHHFQYAPAPALPFQQESQARWQNNARPTQNVVAAPQRGKINQNQVNRHKKNDQQYFQSEAEAQAWEDHCLENHLEALAPSQFLQNVTGQSSKKTSSVTQAGQGQPKKNGKPKVTLAKEAAPSSGEQSFKMKFKTEICKFWQLNGVCEFSDSCSFAHGVHELKKRTDQPRNYKTKQCKRYHKELYCPYGPRCQFLHDKQPQKANSNAKKTSLASLEKSESSTAADISYTSLLNHVNETLLQEPLAAPVSQPLPVNPDLKIPEISATQTSSRRLRVFEDIPDTLSNRSDSQISIQ